MSSAITKTPGVLGRPDNLLWVDPLQVYIPEGENPRTEDLALEELLPQIKARGYRQDRPISVYKDDQNRIVLIDGQRRLLCVRQLIAEGTEIPRIPAILLPRMADPMERLLSALAGNQGRNLTPTDEARAYDRFVNNGWTVEKIAQEVGRSAVYIHGRLTLLDATPAVVEAMHNGSIGMNDAIKVVREAEREGIPQAVKLAEKQERKATKVDKRSKTYKENKALLSPDAEILNTLRPLVEKYGHDRILACLENMEED